MNRKREWYYRVIMGIIIIDKKRIKWELYQRSYSQIYLGKKELCVVLKGVDRKVFVGFLVDLFFKR